MRAGRVLWVAGLMAISVTAKAASDDFRSFVDQAKFFLKKQWFNDALEQLELAVGTDDGRIDPEAWYLLATVRYQLCDVEGAKEAASRAHSYSRNDAQLQSSAALSDFMIQQFGVVELIGLQPGYSLVEVQLESILFDPALKTYLKRLDVVLKKQSVLFPHRLGLPAGKYIVNGRSIDVKVGDDKKVMVDRIDKGPVAVQVTQIELAAGVSVWTGTGISNLLPAPTTQLAVSQPVSRVVLGATVDWTPRPYQTGSGIVVSGNAFAVGGRVGIEWPGTEPMALRTSVGYRYGLLPGVETHCTNDTGSFTCRRGGRSELLVYPVARAHIPHLETVFTYQDRNRDTNVGIGLKTTADYALGRFPAEAKARRLNDDTKIPYTIAKTDRGFSAFGFRVMANLLVGF